MTKYTDAKERLHRCVDIECLTETPRPLLPIIDKRYNNNLLCRIIREKPVILACGRFLINFVRIVLVTVPDYTH